MRQTSRSGVCFYHHSNVPVQARLLSVMLHASTQTISGQDKQVNEDTVTRCEGVFRCGTMQTHCRKHATLRRCGKHFCDSCARWNRHTMDTREVQRCPQHNHGNPCNNLAGKHRLGWCDEHVAEYETIANNLRTEIDSFK